MNLKLLSLSFAGLLITGCGAKETTETPAIGMPALPDGAYLLSDVQVTENGELSLLLRDQIKIYSNNRFMYAFMNAETGIDVGAGIATWKNGVMVEVPTVNHNGPVKGYSFDVAIKETDDGFMQTIMGMTYDDGRSLDMVETWDTASTRTGLFDGLWRLQKRSSAVISSADFVETKMIGGGHFIWLQRWSTDGETQKSFGFGTIDVNDDGSATETGMTSSIEDYAGTEHRLNLTLIDDNHFSQTFMIDDVEVTQTYQRM
ncbi:MAG: hypothetical protein O2950_08765 [Proteobacteria bacterium]|jgi:hypothetical protein|nr:hypothetical protein [Pseudomonadota bacterium]MDA1352363.1 hypothetical protein [Pseudomonadota bacterium]|tara:strand:- start:1144 stop:1920 length:777 start_codon:yes stop_codon:yes gene_type:complete